MIEDLEQFQFIILSQNTVNHLIEILNKKIAPSRSVKLLEVGVNIDNQLNVDIHIKKLWKVVNAKLKGLGTVTKILSILQAKEIYNSLFIFSYFNLF